MNTRQDGAPVADTEEDWFLADVGNDPPEVVNLADDPNGKVIAQALRQKILDHVAGSVEPEFVPAFSEDEAPEFRPPRIG
jgi:choline-sulfatase